MIIMAQHHCQQLRNPQQAHHYQQPANTGPTTNHIQAQQFKENTNQTASSVNGNTMQQTSNHQLDQQQDGKRTLIKNQLYLIEQLQLENVNLRNERDQLQLENEELKFQLQMISSSNILSQPGNAFNDQNLERLVEPSNAKSTNPINAEIVSQTSNVANVTKVTNRSNLKSNNDQSNSKISCVVVAANTVTNNNRSSGGGTPVRHFVRLNNVGDHNFQRQQDPVTTVVRASDVGENLRPTSLIESSIIPSKAAGNKLLAGKSTSLTAFNAKQSIVTSSANSSDNHQPSNLVNTTTIPKNNLNLPQDEEEQRVKRVEQLYGDSEHVQAAAIIIQRAFRKYQICKRFRTITEQLRHTYQSSSASNNATKTQCPDNLSTRTATSTSSSSGSSSTTTTSSGNLASSQQAIGKPQPELAYAWGTTRAAAWESLSQAASRLAASAASTVARPVNGIIKTSASGQPAISTPQQQQQQQQQQNSRIPSSQQQQQVPLISEQERQMACKQDPVVTAAINFQQLESIRKRQYRVGLNIFNKNPEKGVSFLVAHSFIDSSPPYNKTSTYYPSDQLHFIDKQHLVNQQQYKITGNPNSNCQMCYEEDNLKRNVAHFLLHRKGLAKEMIGQYLGNLQAQFNQDVLKYYLQELDFYGLQIDLGLRKFLSTFRLPGEAQKIERIVDYFAQRYVQCQQQQQPLTASLTSANNIASSLSPQKPQQQQQQQLQQNNLMVNPIKQQQQQQQQSANNTLVGHKNNLILLTKDEIFILTFAIIMLNTDLHSPSLKPTSRMSAAQFVNNLRGVFKSQIINESDLVEIYERVKANQITTTPDHVTHVMKVQQGLTVSNFQKKELPNLSVPHRRLVCFCRLFEVYDANKKERIGQHQREIFLFNDLLLVTKLARRVRANTTQLYTYRQSVPLQGLCVQLFQSAHYNFGIRLHQRSTDETVIMFNARNELDQSRFVDDLTESIAEMDEMEMIKTNNIIETIHFRFSERLKRHSNMHSVNCNKNESSNNIIQSKQGNSVLALDDNQASKKMSLINNCDIRIGSNNERSPASAIDIGEDNDRQIVVLVSGQQASRTTAREPSSNTFGDHHDDYNRATIGRDRSHNRVGKFSCSMLDLSSAAIPTATTTTDDKSDSSKNEQGVASSRAKGLRQNQSFVQVPTIRSAKSDQSGGSGGDRRVGGAGEQVIIGFSEMPMAPGRAVSTATSTAASHRRCSTSSVHSLDSGLFLSRDVSPNQSS